MNFDGKILLIDDEPHIRKYVGLIARSALGTPILIEAANGQEGVAAYERDQPDFVLLDINMPVMDGLETLAAIRQIDEEAVIVMLTSLTNRQSIDEAIKLGATSYIRKDTPKDQIAAALVELVNSVFAEDEDDLE